MIVFLNSNGISTVHVVHTFMEFMFIFFKNILSIPICTWIVTKEKCINIEELEVIVFFNNNPFPICNFLQSICLQSYLSFPCAYCRVIFHALCTEEKGVRPRLIHLDCRIAKELKIWSKMLQMVLSKNVIFLYKEMCTRTSLPHYLQ